jgi:hypothetical protein
MTFLPLQVSRVSSLARDALERSREGRVLHVFPSGLYVETSAGDVVVLVSAELPFGPLSVGVAGLESRLGSVAPTMHVHWPDNVIMTEGLAIRLDGAQVWEARPRWEDLHLALADTPRFLSWLRVGVLRRAPAGSLAELLEDHPRLPASALLEAARARASIFVASLAAASRGSTQEMSALRWASAALAGLGAGFTPSGDDFLMGAMHAIWASLPTRSARRLSKAVAEAAAPRTTTASGAYLWAAAGGAAGEGWHDLVRALNRSDKSAAEGALTGLTTIGHTSGADALAGFIQGLGAFYLCGSAQAQLIRFPAAASGTSIRSGQELP